MKLVHISSYNRDSKDEWNGFPHESQSTRYHEGFKRVSKSKQNGFSFGSCSPYTKAAAIKDWNRYLPRPLGREKHSYSPNGDSDSDYNEKLTRQLKTVNPRSKYYIHLIMM